MKVINKEEIIRLLIAEELNYSEILTFSKRPGIYAIFFTGYDFPILGNKVKPHQIIYIGKTESSQLKRDAKTHFKTGKTGSSTVRKSIGSILYENENLSPIPRNYRDYRKNRFNQFKFDNKSEKIITRWMESNLALSFFEYPKTKQEIESLESELINELVPILNIAKNSKNAFKGHLQQLRKNCASIARKNSPFISLDVEKIGIKIPDPKRNAKPISISGIIYIDNISESDTENRTIRIKVVNKPFFPEEQPGIVKTYSLDFSVGDYEFVAQYTIGSKDRKSRSGILKLGNYVYNDIFKIESGTYLKLNKSRDNKYSIERTTLNSDSRYDNN